MAAAIQHRLDSGPALPPLSAFDILSPGSLSEEDLRRGILLLLYQTTIESAPSPGIPRLPAGMQLAPNPAGVFAASSATDGPRPRTPRRALAFFRQDSQRIRLDWEVFIQTWDRSLAAFRDGRLGDGPMRFRVVIVRGAPTPESAGPTPSENFCLLDPLHAQDMIQIKVDSSAAPAPQLAAMLAQNPDAASKPWAATLDLKRDPQTGLIYVHRFVCHEFLGLGGVSSAAE